MKKTLIKNWGLLAFALTTTFLQVKAQTPQAAATQPSHTLTSPLENELNAYRATNTITASSLIDEDSRVVFRSEGNIELNSGFKVEAGADFRAEIGETMIVYDDGNGLVYETDTLWPDGNRVPDFSFAGYRNGEESLPVFSVITGLPRDLSQPDTNAAVNMANITQNIQYAKQQGLEGAIVLGPGLWELPEGIVLDASNVVLRGAGDGSDPLTDTILKILTTDPTAVALTIGDKSNFRSWAFSDYHESGTLSYIETDSIPANTNSFILESGAITFNQGDEIAMVLPCDSSSIPNWFDVLEAEYASTDDVDWSCGESLDSFQIEYKRTVASYNATTRKVTLVEPIYAPWVNRTNMHGYIVRFNPMDSLLVRNVGAESLRVDIAFDDSDYVMGGFGLEYVDENHAAEAVRFQGVEDAWMRDVTMLHFSRVGVGTRVASRVTVQDSKAIDPVAPRNAGSRRYNFNIGGWTQFVLYRDNYSNDARHAYISNGGSSVNGIVFLNNVSNREYQPSESHKTWSHGLLFDNHQVTNSLWFTSLGPDVKIRFGHNYGNDGCLNPATNMACSGYNPLEPFSHGWATANSVIWNADMDDSKIVAHKPPTTQNFVVGFNNLDTVINQYGTPTLGPSFNDPLKPFVDGAGITVSPNSLYLAQLEDRGFTAEPLTLVDIPEEEEYQIQQLAEPEILEGLSIDAYPNPFNTSVTLSYSLSEDSHVKIEIFDVLGRVVAVLIDQEVKAGQHLEKFTPSDGLRNGLYIYRINTKGGSKSGSVMLLK